jgi:ABC-type nitrate/sulfonate/bicarbonate transport system substrate-binding protein
VVSSGCILTFRIFVKLRDNPDEVKRFIRAMVKAARYFLSHRDESVALLHELAQTVEGDRRRRLRSLNQIGESRWIGQNSAIKTQLGLIKQTTGKDVKVEAVIDFTLLRQVSAETR